MFSGVQPSGSLHIGNYIGALQQWAKLQDEDECIFCIVDLHAITVPQDPKVLREKILEVAALYLACGVNPEKSHIFIQSENLDHTYLAWVFDCLLDLGQLFRMTQFKEKVERLRRERMTADALRDLFVGPVGLFNYPALMAADILLYDTDQVPVGEDQKQHIELTRDVADKFNKTFAPVFKLPEPLIQRETARIMSLQNPLFKMSKSDKDPMGTINLLDSQDLIVEKVKKAVTDSGTDIVKREDKPAMSNLLTIYSSISDMSISALEQKHKAVGYAEFKKDLSEVVVSFLSKIQQRYRAIRQDENQLRNVLDEGRDYAISQSSKKIKEVNEAVGLGR